MSDENDVPETDENDDFGFGIFDSPVVGATEVSDEPTEDVNPMELTDREIAIAEGRNPDEAEATTASPSADGEKLGEESPSVEETTDETPEVKEPTWTESDKRLAQHYGVSDEQLANFDSSKSFLAAIDLLEARPKSETSEGDAGSPNEKPSDAGEDKGVASSPTVTKTDVDEVRKIFEAKNDADEFLYDEDTRKTMIDNAERSRANEDLLEKVLEQVGQPQQPQFSDAERAEMENNRTTFHDALDKVPGLYGQSVKDGKPVELAARHIQYREEIAEHVQMLHEGAVSKGKEPPALKTLIKQAVRAIHGDKLAEAAKRSQNLETQSKSRRRPGTKVAPSRKESSAEDDSQYDPSNIANDPELVDYFENAHFESGTQAPR